MSHPTLRLKRAYLAMRRAVEQAVRPFDFTAAQFDVLQLLLHQDGLEHRDLQNKLAIASPTLTNIVDGMVRDGHVVRSADVDDGRVKRIYLGASARALCGSAEFGAAGDALVTRMFDGFTETERHQFLRLLGRVEANLETA